MRAALLKHVAFSVLALASSVLLTSCGTTTTAHVANRSLPAYEAPMARSDFQTVRTTAYTHTESDHLAYGARNALGGRLEAASIPRGRVENVPKALPISAIDDPTNITFAMTSKVKHSKAKDKKAAKEKSKKKEKVARNAKGKKIAKTKAKPQPPTIGSAAADWSRFPVGTRFRVLSTGQTYKVDDYGWALAGRNTIDLYMASRGDMNNWGVRSVQIQVLHWGDPQASLALLTARQHYKHCRRMVLELQGKHEEAAALH